MTVITDAELRLACLDRALKAYENQGVSIAGVVKCADMFYAFARSKNTTPERRPDGRFKAAQDARVDPEPVNFADEAMKPASLLHRAFGSSVK